MKIAVISANGKAGSLIVKEAIERGHEVTAIVRGENKTLAKKIISKDLFNLTKEDLQGFDAVVSAFATWSVETLEQHTSSLQYLSDLISETDTRLLVVVGAGSLFTDESLSTTISETPEFPKDYLPVANAMKNGLNELKKRNDVKWTYISPAGDFDFESPKTGKYILSGEIFTVNDKGESFISYSDYAIAFVDEIEKGNHIKQRISVLGK